MTWIILGVIALVVIFVIVSYNGLVKNRMQTKEAWSQIDVQLKRRNRSEERRVGKEGRAR